MQQTASYPRPPRTFWEGLRYCHDPRILQFHFRSLRQTEESLAALTHKNLSTVRETLHEITTDEKFLCDLAERYRQVIGRELKPVDFMFLTGIDPRPPFRVLAKEAGGLCVNGAVEYTLIRLLKPSIIVETGGTPGNSSAFILRALDRNEHGVLHTIDLPPAGDLHGYEGKGDWIHAGMPEGETSGWAVPHALRSRQHQHLSDARELLPKVLAEVPEVDIFIHDSDHSYEHMKWEFETAWPHIKSGGILMSDDVATNAAWIEFVQTKRLESHPVFGMAGARKP